jgi:hypothetical protein
MLLVLLLATLLPAQEISAETAVGKNPLILTSKGWTFSIVNRSGKTINSYRLSCAKVSTGGAFVIHTFEVRESILAPSQSITKASFDGPLEEVKVCQARRADLVISEATFADGSKWKIDSSEIRWPHLPL